jgi:transcriptional regulator with XRE-family HTH domain
MTPSKLHAHVARRIRDKLRAKGMSAEKLALEIEMSRGYIYEFLNGKKNITIDTLQRIADGLEIKIRDLFPE